MFSLCVCICLVSPTFFTISFQLLGELDLKMSMVGVFVWGYVGNFKQKYWFFVFHLYETFFNYCECSLRTFFVFLYFLFLGAGYILPSLAVSVSNFEVRILVRWRCLTSSIFNVSGICREFSLGIFYMLVRILVFRLMKGSQNLCLAPKF